MDAVLQFTVSNQRIEKTNEFTVVEGSENYLRAQFTITTPDWDGMFLTGVFIDEDGTVHPSLCDNGVCDVPPQWLVRQKGAVGLYGSDGVTKITTNTAKVHIKDKGYGGDTVDEETAAAYFDQIMAALTESKEFVTDQAEKAKEASASAEAWAHGHKDYSDRDQDNAQYYAGQARDIAAGVPGQVEDAKKRIDSYVAGKERELKGDTGNVYFAAFKVVNGRLIMYSDPSVDRVRFVRRGSRLKYRIVM